MNHRCVEIDYFITWAKNISKIMCTVRRSIGNVHAGILAVKRAQSLIWHRPILVLLKVCIIIDSGGGYLCVLIGPIQTGTEMKRHFRCFICNNLFPRVGLDVFFFFFRFYSYCFSLKLINFPFYTAYHLCLFIQHSASLCPIHSDPILIPSGLDFNRGSRYSFREHSFNFEYKPST